MFSRTVHAAVKCLSLVLLFASGVAIISGSASAHKPSGSALGEASVRPSTGDAFMELVPQGSAPPNGGTAHVGDRFVLDLLVNTGSHTDALAQQSYFTFTYSVLQNIDVAQIATGCISSTRVTPDLTVFDDAAQNEVCNTAVSCIRGTRVIVPGSVGFASYAALNCPNGCGGVFRVAQIGLCAIAPGTATLHWQFSPPAPIVRDTEVNDVNSDVIDEPALFTDYVINVLPANTPTPTPGQAVIVGHANWQGSPAQPHIRQQLPITLTLKMGNIEVNFPVRDTDASGYFTNTLAGLPQGTYSWRTKGPKYLATSGVVNVGPAPTTNLEVGLMRAADANNDNVVNLTDFVIMRNSFGRAPGEADYDPRGDFNNDNVVNVLDTNWQKTNQGTSGAPPIAPGR